MRNCIFILILGLLGITNTYAQTYSSPYYLYIGAVRPLARLSYERVSYPGHCFVGYVVRDYKGKDSIQLFCGNHPTEPLLKNILTHHKTQKLGTLKGEFHLDDQIYYDFQKSFVLQIQVSAEQFAHAVMLRDKWEQSKEFRVGKTDCVGFTESICTQVLHLNAIPRKGLQNLLPIWYWKSRLQSEAHRTQRINPYLYEIRLPAESITTQP